MDIYEYSDTIGFCLPSGFIFSRKEDDGDEIVRIMFGEYENDDGETAYHFSCRVGANDFTPEDLDAPGDVDYDPVSEGLLDSVEGFERHIWFPGSLKTVAFSDSTSYNLFGHGVKLYNFCLLIQLDDWEVLVLVSSQAFNDDASEDDLSFYENMLEVAKAVRLNGRALPINWVTPEELQEAVGVTFEDDDEPVDLTSEFSSFLNFDLADEDETIICDYTADGIKEISRAKLTSIDPDESLYPHYNSIHSNFTSALGFLGIAVNATGTEYEFYPLSRAVGDYDTSQEIRALYNRIITADIAFYNLNEKAEEMQRLFHVDAAVFDSQHDRECELDSGLMRRAYMMSGLRSFAWTLADYCNNYDVESQDIDGLIASRIANFVADRGWLNYDGDTYCKGLCSGSDLHVYYIPNGVAESDKKKLLPSKEALDRAEEIKENLPFYNEIFQEIHSLDELREDLEYIYPAVRQLWEHLKAARDYNEPLTGNEADIVYAWCALALAAKEPFFTQDGPVDYGYDQIVHEVEREHEREIQAKIDAEKHSEEWLGKYGNYITNNPQISFAGKLFVFAECHKGNSIVQHVIEKGGQFRSSVSGLTDYLVVDPRNAGTSKILAVMKQQLKGKNVEVILLADLEAALKNQASLESTVKTSSTKSSSSAKKSSVTSATTTMVKATKAPENDYEISGSGILINYYGSAANIILPDGIKGIGRNALALCEELTSIVIPDGVEEIGAYAFYGCDKLTDIYIPASVTDIGDGAFDTCNDSTVIHAPFGSPAANIAREQGGTVDHEMPSLDEVFTPATKKTYSTNAEMEDAKDAMGDLVNAMAGIDTQISQLESLELSTEDLESLQENQGMLNNIRAQVAESQVGLAKYGDYLEQQEAREKKEQEEKALKKAEALAAGNSEKDVVNMYIILTNEKKLGKLHRSEDEFYESYEDEFGALTKAEIIETRKDMLVEMEHEDRCSHYAENFKQRSVSERFTVATLNLNNVCEGIHYGDKARYAINNTREWFTPDEYAEVQHLMDANLDRIRKDIDDQLGSIDEAWKKYSTGKEFLQIVVKKKEDGDLEDTSSCFQLVIDSDLIAVQIVSKGSMIRMSTTVMNFFPWYWDVTTRDIWESAMKNEFSDQREGAYNGSILTNQAIAHIRQKYPDVKISSSNAHNVSTSSNPAKQYANTSASSSYIARSADAKESGNLNTQPAKQEGCYIATAVYSSYNAPEVITLRRYRDEILKNSVFGRWFIRTYYRLSPPIAKSLKHARHINCIVKFVLDKEVEKLNKSQQ